MEYKSKEELLRRADKWDKNYDFLMSGKTVKDFLASDFYGKHKDIQNLVDQAYQSGKQEVLRRGGKG